MHTRSYIQSRSGSRGGVALIAVLVFIVLLTILTVSYISFTGLNRLSTTSYSKSIQAQEVAQGGLQDILSDLHNEIIAGSIKDISGTTYTVNGTTIYIPATNQTAMPARIGYASSKYGNDTTSSTLSPTLIRVSRATANPNAVGGDSFFTQFATPTATSYYTNNITAVPGQTILNRASLASTATNSVDGRSISAARWNKTYLLAPYSSVIPSPFTAAPPDWVYVTHTGSRVCTSAEAKAGTLSSSSNPTQNYGATTPGVNPPASPVVGRYAFVMYDESALLDMNVAGNTTESAAYSTSAHTNMVSSPADPTTGMTQTINGKSYLASADLTKLPGNLTQALVEAFVQWRNASCGSTGNNYLLGLMTYAKTGFLSLQPLDSPILGRQDLINYFAKIDTNINQSTATYSKDLPYLGTFTRAISAPVAIPRSNAVNPTSVYAYHSNAEVSTTAPFSGTSPNPNRDFANVRFANPGLITHYTDDATAGALTYSVNVGDQLLQSRFSLAKINWLAQPDPTTGLFANSATYATPIQVSFGLVWGAPGSTSTNSNTSTSTANGGNPCWNYIGSPVGPSGSSQAVAGVIETLDQVAKEGREPNFFELLKAAILNGSLGLGPGLAAFGNGAHNTPDPWGAPYDVFNAASADQLGAGSIFSNTFGPNSTVPVPQRIPDVQIIQIGANIIDQYDADSYPTAIYFPYSQVIGTTIEPVTGSAANAIYGPVDMVYGDENLPVFSKIQEILCSPNPSDPNDSNGNGDSGAPSPDDSTHSFEGWLQPELWNPHQAPGPASTFGANSLGPNVPHTFEIRAYGSAMTFTQPTTGTAYLTSDGTVPNGWVAAPPTYPTAINTPSNQGNWGFSNSPLQSYYTGSYSTEKPTDGTNEEAGTITFTDGSASSSFYAHPHLLVIPGDSGSITGLTSVTSPLPVPSNAALGEQPTDIAQPNFPYWAAPGNYGLNHFVAFSAGLISDLAGSGPPYMPYYVPSTAASTPISGSNSPAVNASVNFPVTASGVGCTSFALGWYPNTGNPATDQTHFHPYSFITGAFMMAYNTIYDDSSHTPDGRVGAVGPGPSNIQENTVNWGLVDPRTNRFVYSGNFVEGAEIPNETLFYYNYSSVVSPLGGIPKTGNFTTPQPTNGSSYPEDWMMNFRSVATTAGQQRTSVYATDPRSSLATPTYYADPDGVVRPGDGWYSNIATGDVMTFTTAGTGGSAYGDTVTTGDFTGNTSHGRRPVILNRPFRSVGELGYVFRDLPFKTLDFFTPYSADAALLDVFSISDDSSVNSSTNKLTSIVAGRFNPSYAAYPTTQAIVAGASKKDLDGSYNVGVVPAVSAVDAQNVAQAIYTNVSSSAGPLMSRADLVVQLSSALQSWNTSASPWTINYTLRTATDQYNKTYLEAPVRALADVTNTRTWNLLIDIIAQSGQMSPTATTLDNFVVQGERRYWLHIAIDRYTGKIVDQQLEPVYE